MTMAANSRASGILVATLEEVPRTSEAERQALMHSLAQARADIAAGNFDIVTSQSLQAEFDGIIDENEADAENDAEPISGPAP